MGVPIFPYDILAEDGSISRDTLGNCQDACLLWLPAGISSNNLYGFRLWFFNGFRCRRKLFYGFRRVRKQETISMVSVSDSDAWAPGAFGRVSVTFPLRFRGAARSS